MKFTRKSQNRDGTALELRRANRRARIVRSSINSSNVAKKASTPVKQSQSRKKVIVISLLAILFLFWTAVTTGIEIKPSDNSLSLIHI